MDAIINKPNETIGNYEKVFEQYLAVCNLAIEKNKDKFPYMEIWRTRWNNLGADNVVECAVYDDRPKIIYKLQLTEDMKIKIIDKRHVLPSDAWPFKYSYLKHVVENPQDYIDHPVNLDWGWLTGVLS